MKCLFLYVTICTLTIANTQKYGNDQIYFADNKPTRHYTNNPRYLQPMSNFNEMEHNQFNHDNNRFNTDGRYGDNNKKIGQAQAVTAPNDDAGLPLQSHPMERGTTRNDLQSNEGKTSLALTNFGLRLLKLLDQKSQNAVMSPLSIAISLGLLEQGAYRETQNQIASALQMKPEEANTAFKTILNNIKSSPGNILNIATNLFVSAALRLNPAFKTSAIQNYNSDVTPVSFTNTVSAANTINEWVAMKTNNKIEKLVTPDMLDANSLMVLANAVFFKGTWKTTFNPKFTTYGDFKLSGGQNKSVPFMEITHRFKAGFDRKINSKIVVLPFENDEYSLMVILPDANTNLDNVISNIRDDQLRAYHGLPRQEVNLELPKFTIRSETDLKSVLQRMGVTNIFNSKSELFGIGMHNDHSTLVNSAAHSAVFAIDEKGGSAAAATAFAIVPLSSDDFNVLYMKVDRPFLAVLWMNESKIPLFIARVEEP